MLHGRRRVGTARTRSRSHTRTRPPDDLGSLTRAHDTRAHTRTRACFRSHTQLRGRVLAASRSRRAGRRELRFASSRNGQTRRGRRRPADGRDPGEEGCRPRDDPTVPFSASVTEYGWRALARRHGAAEWFESTFERVWPPRVETAPAIRRSSPRRVAPIARPIGPRRCRSLPGQCARARVTISNVPRSQHSFPLARASAQISIASESRFEISKRHDSLPSSNLRMAG